MRCRATVAAGTTLVAGFGAMNILWLIVQPTQLRGLYSYASATLGDAIALPLIAYSLSRLDTLLPPRRNRMGLALGSLIGALVGAGTTWAWLADPNPIPNWTLPEPGRFTAAGWYHAAFMVGASTVLGGSFVDRLMRVPKDSGPSAQRHLAAVLGSVSAFAGLCMVDNFGRINLSSGASAMVAAALLGVAATLIPEFQV